MNKPMYALMDMTDPKVAAVVVQRLSAQLGFWAVKVGDEILLCEYSCSNCQANPHTRSVRGEPCLIPASSGRNEKMFFGNEWCLSNFQPVTLPAGAEGTRWWQVLLENLDMAMRYFK
jgi:hypothetical protein